MRNLIVDLRLALRHALRRPGFALAAILSLALGVGAVTVVFSLVDAVVLRPLDVPRAEGLVALHRVGGEDADISLPDAVALRRELRQLDAVSLVATDRAKAAAAALADRLDTAAFAATKRRSRHDLGHHPSIQPAHAPRHSGAKP